MNSQKFLYEGTVDATVLGKAIEDDKPTETLRALQACSLAVGMAFEEPKSAHRKQINQLLLAFYDFCDERRIRIVWETK